MARSKLLLSLFVLVGVCALAAPSFAAAAKASCSFTGDYAFMMWDTDDNISASGWFGVNCAGLVTGGEIFCNDDGDPYESIIQNGLVFVHPDGTGDIVLEADSDICDISEALELDVSIVNSGKTVLFNSNGIEYVESGVQYNTGYGYYFTGRADRAYSGATLAGNYDLRLWAADSDFVGDIQLTLAQVNGLGVVVTGFARCNTDFTEYEQQVTTGGFTLFGDSTGYLWFETVDEDFCGEHAGAAFDIALAFGGNEILFNCDADLEIQGNRSLPNGAEYVYCAGEGFKQ